MSEDRQATRAELTEQLESERAEKVKLELRLEALEKAFAASQETDAQRAERERRLAAAEAELAALRPTASQSLTPLSGKAPKFVPYKGTVRAKEDCAYGGYRYGPDPSKGRHADVFEVDVPTLWSDDPFEPVRVVGQRDDGTPICERRTDVPVIDYRWRPRATVDLMARAV